MKLTPGMRLRSRVCETEVIVVRLPQDDIELHCGGFPMAAHGAQLDDVDVPAPGWDDGARVGKRYTSVHAAELEVLVTHSGKGTLGDGSDALVVKESKPLPSSD